MKTTLLGTVALAASALAGCANAKPDVCRIFFGTSAKDEQRGIYMAELDMKTGALSDAVRVSKAMRPGFIAIDSSGSRRVLDVRGVVKVRLLVCIHSENVSIN